MEVGDSVVVSAHTMLGLSPAGLRGLCRSDKGRFIQGRGAAGQVTPRQVDANSGTMGSRIPGEEPGRVDESNSRIGETKGSRSPLSKTLTLQRPHSISLTGIADCAWNGRGGSSDFPCGTLEGTQAQRGASVDGGETMELRVFLRVWPWTSCQSWG